MSKKGWKLLTGLLVLSLLLVSYFVLKNKNQEETEEEEVYLLDIETENVTNLDIKNGNSTISFAKEEDNWTVSGEDGFPLNETELENVLTDLSELSVEKTLEDIDDLSEFELDSADKTVTIQMDDGTEHVITVGMENTSLSQYYITIDGEQPVYLVETGNLSFLDNDLYNYAQTTEFPVIASSEIRTVNVETADSTYQYIYEGVEGSNSSWSVSEDGEAYEAADSSVISDINTSINSLSYTEMVDYNCQDKTQYGLDDPTAVITIQYEVEVEEEDSSEDSSEDDSGDEEDTTTTESRQVILYVGSENDNGYYYVSQDDSNEVYTIYTDTINTIISEDYSSLLDTTVSYVAMSDLENLRIVSDGEEYILETVEETTEEEESDADNASESESTSDSENTDSTSDSEDTADSESEDDTSTIMKYYVNQEEVESGDFTTFYSKLITAGGQSRDDGLSEEGLTCDLELHFTETDGTVTDVYYYPYDTNFYLAVNGEKKLLVNKMNVKEIKDTLVELASGTENTESAEE